MWQGKLRSQYKSKGEFNRWNAIYCLASRLGFASADEAWQTNPVIQGSSNPGDYRVVALADWDIVDIDQGWFYAVASENVEVHLRQDSSLGYEVTLLRDAMPMQTPSYHERFADAITEANEEINRLRQLTFH